jgi:hypothetical protein
MNKNAKSMTIMVPYNVTIDRIKDLLTSAFEGGSNYWVECSERVGEAKDRKQAEYLCDAPFIKDGYLKIKEEGHEAKDGRGGWFNIDPKTIAEGLVIMAKKYPNAWSDFVSENDDAGTGDTFLQCVCFGEEIYG